MGSHRKRSRRKKSLLPRLSTVALLLVIGVAIWFFREMYYVKEDVANKELVSLEAELVKKQAKPLIDAIGNGITSNKEDVAKRAMLIKNNVDSTTIARLDTFLIRNNRYKHLEVAIDESILPLINDSSNVNYYDTLVVLMTEYNNLVQLSIADSCLEIAKSLAIKNK